MSLIRIAAAKTRKRRYMNGGESDPEGAADAGRGDVSGSSGPEPGQGAGEVNAGAFGGSGSSNVGGDSLAGGNGAQQGPAGPSTGGSTEGFSGNYSGPTGTGAEGQGSVSPNAPEIGSFAETLANALTGIGSKASGLPGTLGILGGLANLAGKGINAAYDGNTALGGRGSNNGPNTGNVNEHQVPEKETQPFGASTPAQTTPAAGDTGMRKYVWDPVSRQYTLSNVGAGANPMGYTQGQTFQMAAGGPAPSGISAGAPRFVQGGGTGLSDGVPVKMDDGGEGRLADGEFVVPADVVSGLGGGSSKAGADILYQMMERIRQQAHGSKQQVRPVDPQQVLPA